MLNIINKWVEYYAEDRNLSKMTDEEVIKIKEIFYKVPFSSYSGYYFEYVDAFLDTVIYYGSCPINKIFDKSKIKRKG